MPDYKNLPKFGDLEKFGEKKDGKETNSINGFYKDKQGNEFFIKKPSEKKELFTEFFAGKIISLFKEEGLISKTNADGFICADLINVGDSEFALIQPKKEFTLLCEKTSGSKQRRAFYEMINGKNAYTNAISSLDSYFGLSLIVFISLLFSDYSIHGGNIGLLTGPYQNQFCRFDFGASFRHFFKNEKISNPHEYTGLAVYKKFTKNYLSYYQNIPGFYETVAEKAEDFLSNINQPELKDIVSQAFNSIPKSVFLQKDMEEISKYMGLDTYDKDIFVEKISHHILKRAKDIKDELATQEKSENTPRVYKSTIVNKNSSIFEILSITEKESEDDIISKEESVISKEESVISKEESVISKEESVISKEESVISKEESVISKEESVINKEESVINKEESVINKEESVINKEESVINKEESVINKEESVINNIVASQDSIDLKIIKEVARLTDEYLSSLVKKNSLASNSRGIENEPSDKNSTILEQKIKILYGLQGILGSKKKESREKIELFYTQLYSANATLVKHHDEGWKHFTKNAALILGIILTGILPGLLVVGAIALTGYSPKLWQSSGQTFFQQAKKEIESNRPDLSPQLVPGAR